MPICTTCMAYTPYLYTVYESAYNLRLEQCRKCHFFADPYVEHDSLTLLLDLILLKRGVYLHLLYNRGTRPRRAITDLKTKPETKLEQKESQETDTSYLWRARWIWTLKLGTGLIILDAFIRWTHLRPKSAPHHIWTEESFLTFIRVLFGCLAETLAFHAGILLSCFVILKTLALIRHLYSKLILRLPFLKTRPRHKPDSVTPGREFNLSLIPLTLFYSSLTKLFLLFLLTIWVPASPTPSLAQLGTEIPSDWLHQIVSNPATVLPAIFSNLSQIFDDDKMDREWIIRNILGGMSAGFGLKVILDVHPFFSTLIILSGWASKNVVSQLVGDWVGGDTQTSQAWLAYSIP